MELQHIDVRRRECREYLCRTYNPLPEETRRNREGILGQRLEQHEEWIAQQAGSSINEQSVMNQTTPVNYAE